MVFFFNDTATTEIYTLSLHDALPIFGRIECQWVSITVERTVKRHPRIDTVIQRPFDDIGELRVSGGRKHSPVPHHVADGSTAFPVGPIVRQFVGIAEGLASRARANSSGNVHLVSGHVVPQRVERSEERRVGKECRSRWSPYH